MALPSKNTQLNEIADFDIFRNGGKGSGNFGHAGRPGERGGSSTDPVAIGKTFDEDRDGGGRLKEYKYKLREVEKALKDDAYRDQYFYGLSKERLEESKTQLERDIKRESDRIGEAKARTLLDSVAHSVMGGDLSDFDPTFERLVAPVKDGNLSKKQVESIMMDGTPQLSKDKTSIYYAESFRLHSTSTTPAKSAADLKSERKEWKKRNPDY